MPPAVPRPSQPLDAPQVRAEMLARAVEGEMAAVSSALVGVAVLLAVTWSGPHRAAALALMLWRLLALWHNYRVTRRIEAVGPHAALAQRLHLRLVAGQFLGAVSWGLLAWFIDLDHPVTGAEPVLLLILLTAASMVMLVSMAHFPPGLLAFLVGVWGPCSIRLATAGTVHAAELAVGLVAFLCMLAVYWRRLYRQTRSAVVADLLNRQLTVDLSRANERLSAALARAEDLAMLDPLTGALNRRAFVERATAEAAALARRGEPAVLLLADLDHFKQVNDAHGHAVGDLVLKVVSECLRQHLRTGDAMARWGGEEFLLLLAGSSDSVAREVAERLRQAVMALAPADWPPGLRITLSAGLAPWAAGQPLQCALEAADRALYAAKAAGRNRVHPGLDAGRPPAGATSPT